MLPVDSPRWSKLETGAGTAESTAIALKKIHQLIERDPVDQKELGKAIYEFECDHGVNLYHQQHVYPATAATIPHLVHFIPHRCLNGQISMMELIGMYAFEHPDHNVDDDIAHWYGQAIRTALEIALNIAKGKSSDASDDPTFFGAIAILHDGGTAYYTFRDCGLYDFNCAECQLALHAGYTEETGYKVWDARHGWYPANVDESVKVTVPPAENPLEELAKPEHAPLRFFHDLFVEGDHQFMLKWEQHVLGQFPCPGCSKTIPIKYEWGT